MQATVRKNTGSIHVYSETHWFTLQTHHRIWCNWQSLLKKAPRLNRGARKDRLRELIWQSTCLHCAVGSQLLCWPSKYTILPTSKGMSSSVTFSVLITKPAVITGFITKQHAAFSTAERKPFPDRSTPLPCPWQSLIGFGKYQPYLLDKATASKKLFLDGLWQFLFPSDSTISDTLSLKEIFYR